MIVDRWYHRTLDCRYRLSYSVSSNNHWLMISYADAIYFFIMFLCDFASVVSQLSNIAYVSHLSCWNLRYQNLWYVINSLFGLNRDKLRLHISYRCCFVPLCANASYNYEYCMLYNLEFFFLKNWIYLFIKNIFKLIKKNPLSIF